MRLYERQQAFIQTLTQHPEYGRYVESFTWAYHTAYDPDYVPNRDSDDPEDYDERLREGPMWSAFQTLCRVKSLDFHSTSWEREQVTPLLFLSTTSIRLGVQISFPLLMSFLRIDPAQMVSLEFDSLQDLGQLRDRTDLPADVDLAVTSESSEPNGTRHSGCMRGHLRRLEGRCSNLQHLTL